MLKLYYLTDNTKTEISWSWPNDYSIKIGSDGLPLLTGGNAQGNRLDNPEPHCEGYMVLTNGINDKLYRLSGQNVTEITNLPESSNITHICGGGEFEPTIDTFSGGYIVFNNDATKLYYLDNELSSIVFSKVPSIAGNVIALSGGGGKKLQTGAVVVGSTLYLLKNNSVYASITNSGIINNIIAINIGGYSNQNLGGYFIANVSGNKKLFKCNTGNPPSLFEITDIGQIDTIANKFVSNNINSPDSYPKLYYTKNKNVYYYLPASDYGSANDVINFGSLDTNNAEILFLSGGGGNYSIDDKASGYVVHHINSQYYLHFLNAANAYQIPIPSNQNIIAMSGGNGRSETSSARITNGYMITAENNPCVHKNTIVPILIDGIIIKKLISEVRSGDYVIKFDGTPIRVINNAKLYDETMFVEILPNSLGENIPDNTLYLTKGHPILFNGKEILPSKIENECINIVTLPNLVTVYTLITEERTAVKMNSVDVYTWNKEDFIKRKYNCILL